MTFGKTKAKNFNIKCRSKGCRNLTNKLCQTNSFEGDVVVLLCDKHKPKDVAFTTLPYVIEQDGQLRAKCFSCGNVWLPQTFQVMNYYNRSYKKFGDIPQSCAKCRSMYWKAPHNAKMRGRK